MFLTCLPCTTQAILLLASLCCYLIVCEGSGLCYFKFTLLSGNGQVRKLGTQESKALDSTTTFLTAGNSKLCLHGKPICCHSSLSLSARFCSLCTERRQLSDGLTCVHNYHHPLQLENAEARGKSALPTFEDGEK